jgi:hypothetical protein
VRQLHAIWTWATSLPFGLWPLWDRIPGEYFVGPLSS